MIVVPQVAFHGQEVAMGEELPPVRIVRDLVARGAVQVALLDLDGVVAGDVLPGWVEAIVAVAGVPLRFDGRLHDGARIERLAKAGFGTIVVDQSAVFNQMLLRWAMDLYGSRLCVEVQVDGEYLFDPPPAAFGRELEEVVMDLHFRGVRRLLYRDVTGQAPPLHRLLTLRDRAPGMHITYTGTLLDVDAVSELAMVGPAVEAGLVPADLVLDGTLDLAAANRAATGA